jgi:hypothetical protein
VGATGCGAVGPLNEGSSDRAGASPIQNQACGSGSELDPDSIRSMDPDPVFGIRIQEGKNDQQKKKKIKKFHVLKCWMFSFFFCNLDVLYGGLRKGKL